jgi:hypothetical protein
VVEWCSGGRFAFAGRSWEGKLEGSPWEGAWLGDVGSRLAPTLDILRNEVICGTCWFSSTLGRGLRHDHRNQQARVGIAAIGPNGAGGFVSVEDLLLDAMRLTDNARARGDAGKAPKIPLGQF